MCIGSCSVRRRSRSNNVLLDSLLTEQDPILLVIHLVHEWNIVIFPEFNELKLVFHEAQPSGIQDFNELNEGNMTIFHEWTKWITSEHHKLPIVPYFPWKTELK